ncbi:uncharacterized protein ASPGLDRAFT_43510 [Aspergillus glaucus CBS 516.65]|uniref:Core Histone H2A/H2B/H3 domain-containing protein n=1 Tax=Aspergillus glaucus CBS 516.65 TaxID=1160497 RepID=A0A1L9VT00_ASPGL|nr:hypothetical protein ASPGLDRAFT_43510 [Aspergillus glaucus CBS 516.65]OJJ87037.1 hypothetical protein ASPGLDRAFT_43510 [Aspergillus glaucus CBS 516.65]
MQIESSAVDAIQEATEKVVVDELHMANLAANSAQRAAVQKEDMEFVRQMRQMILGFRFPGQE